jgi:methylmalonyl-CoA mutase C-terminal domain/subunit
MSILSGAHNQIFPEVMRLLKEKGIEDVLVFAGGIIPDEDIPGLKAAGIKAVFQPGTNTDEVVAFIRKDRGIEG